MVYEAHGGDIWSEVGPVLDFSANINPLGMPDAVTEAAIRGVMESTHYPDPKARELTRAFASFFQVPEESVVFGNGASELIRALPRALSRDQNRSSLTCGLYRPSFSEYEEAAEQAGMRIIPISPDLAEIPSDPDLLFLGNPNNPDGRVWGREEIRTAALARPETHFVIDESFLPFCEDARSRTMIPCLSDLENVVVLVSFTKIFAMPGLRLGALVSFDRKLLNRVRSFLQPWPLSLPSMEAGTRALSERAFVERTVRVVSSERSYLVSFLSSLPFVLHVLPSPANFILFASSVELYEPLLQQGILIRHAWGFPGIEGLDPSIPASFWYRIAVRTHGENKRLTEALASVSLR